MKISINLASDPFQRNRPILIAGAAVAVLLTGVLALLLSLAWVAKDEGRETTLAIQKVESELRTLAAEEARLRAVLARPENAEVLYVSLFLNALLMRKGISWTLIFKDIEEALPHNVKLVQVRPEVAPTGASPPNYEILLEMVVASESAEPAIGALKALESSPLFSRVSVSVESQPTETEPLYRYRVSVKYDREL